MNRLSKRWWETTFAVLLSVSLFLPCIAAAQTTVEYIHTDALGSPVAVTNSAGIVIERNNYEPYGAVIGSPAYQGIGYTGHVQDGATGLTYMQQRYYDPQMGLFLSVDPVTAYSSPVGMFNRYRYASNNPYRFTDPDGRQSREGARVPSTGIPFIDWLFAWGDARGSQRQMMEKQFASELSQPQSAKDVLLYTAIAMSAGIGASGRGVLSGTARSGARGASGELTTASGNKYLGNSTGSSASGGSARAPMNSKTQQALNDVHNPSRTHGECCEIDAINKALNAGDDVRGSTMGPVQLNESGRTIPACSTCRDVKKALGVE